MPQCKVTCQRHLWHIVADSLYAALYGLPNHEGRCISKLDYYMGRGSLGEWLRIVLAQRHVDRCRSHAKDISLDEQLEAGTRFAAAVETSVAPPDERVAELDGEERLLLAVYYLDRRTLAAIGRQLADGTTWVSTDGGGSWK